MVKVIQLLSKVWVKSNQKILNQNSNTPNCPPTLGKYRKWNPSPFSHQMVVAPLFLHTSQFHFQKHSFLSYLLLPHSLKNSLFIFLSTSPPFPNTIVWTTLFSSHNHKHLNLQAIRPQKIPSFCVENPQPHTTSKEEFFFQKVVCWS